jgi:hypothetical protein
MALIQCPECKREISNKAAACPHCGCPQSEFYTSDELPTLSPYKPIEVDGKPHSKSMGCLKGLLFLFITLLFLAAVFGIFHFFFNTQYQYKMY